MNPKPKVLFLCTGNSARSQMAEAFLRAYAGGEFDVHSAGTEAKGFILPEVLAGMRERGPDLKGQYSKDAKEYLGKEHFTYVITVCSKAEKNCPIVFLNMGKHEYWPFDDPAEFDGSEPERLDLIRDLRDQVDGRVRRWAEEQGVTPAALKP